MRPMEQKRMVLLILGGNIETKPDQVIAYIMLTTLNPTFI